MSETQQNPSKMIKLFEIMEVADQILINDHIVESINNIGNSTVQASIFDQYEEGFVEKQPDGDYAWSFAGYMIWKSRFDFPSTSWDCDDSELTKRLSAAALKHYPGTK